MEKFDAEKAYQIAMWSIRALSDSATLWHMYKLHLSEEDISDMEQMEVVLERMANRNMKYILEDENTDSNLRLVYARKVEKALYAARQSIRSSNRNSLKNKTQGEGNT